MNEYNYQVSLVVLVIFFLIGFPSNQGNATEVTPCPLGNDLSVYSFRENDQSHTIPASAPKKELLEECP